MFTGDRIVAMVTGLCELPINLLAGDRMRPLDGFSRLNVVGRSRPPLVDDSIVRGTTLRESIITMLSRLNPRRIIIVSSSPPIMYPDCYGIDMSQFGRFIAFQAAVALVKDRGDEALLDEVEQRCREQDGSGDDRAVNPVAAIYERFTLDEISAKVAELVHPPDLSWNGTIEIIYQSVEGLRAAIPDHAGVWYFTGEYPTPGGYRVLQRSYLNWRADNDDRAYELPTTPALLPVTEE